MLVPVVEYAELAPLRDLTAVAVDMGFSGRALSCGIASRQATENIISSENARFGQCVETVANLLGPHKEAVLIIEAPLSAAFSENGNPQARGDFESKPKPRWWSIGAGAVTALAAQYFLFEIVQRISDSIRVYLIEGFVTGANSVGHAEVSSCLLRSLRNDTRSRWHCPKGARLVSVVQWLPRQTANGSPIILIPEGK